MKINIAELLVALFLCVGAAKGQESIIEIPNNTGITASIVRNIDTCTNMVYVHNRSYHAFQRIRNINLVEAMSLSVDTICDFEIFGDTVFICGRRTLNGVSNGYMGFFLLSTFPFSTVTVYPMPGFVCVHELEVTKYAGYTHVVMIGSDSTDQRELIDAVWTGYYWSFESTMNEKDKYYRDVALLNDNVVAIASTDRYASTGSVLVFDAPITLANIFSSSYYNTICQERTARGYVPVKVEKGIGNRCVVTELRLTPSRALTVTQFNPFYGISATMTTIPIFKLNVIDMRHDYSGQNMSILLQQSLTGFAPIMSIIQLEPSTFYGSGLKDQYSLVSSDQMSIGEIDGVPGRFVSSGINTSTELLLYSYDFPHVGRCSSASTKYPTLSNDDWNVERIYISTRRFAVSTEIITVDQKMYEKVVLCEDTFDQKQ